MISALCRSAKTIWTGFAPATTRKACLSFRAPLLPTFSRQFNQRKVYHLQSRSMGNWPFEATTPPVKNTPEYQLGAGSIFVVPNFNFTADKEPLMNTCLEMYRIHNYSHIKIDRGALIASSEWLHGLLTHISDSGSKSVDIVAKAFAFTSPAMKDEVEPTVKQVQQMGERLRGLDKRPEALTMKNVRLTKAMIDALANIMVDSSHGVAFEIHILN
jgi:hypothetical protein